MVTTQDFISYNGIFSFAQIDYGIGNAWWLDITDGIATADTNQDKFIEIIEGRQTLKPSFGSNHVV